MLIVCDLDGTVADITSRMDKAGDAPSKRDKKAFQDWLNKLQKKSDLLSDTPIRYMQAFITTLSKDYDIVYLTGRDEKYRDVTQRWLFENLFPPGRLYMRPQDDIRPTKQYKEEMMLEVVKIYRDSDIVVLDDDPEGTCSLMYKQHGFVHMKAMDNSHE